MKTFVILFAIAISLPSEAQRVKENVRQRVEIRENNSAEVEELKEEVKQAPKKREKVEKVQDALRKQ